MAKSKQLQQVPEEDFDIALDADRETRASADIFRDLKLRNIRSNRCFPAIGLEATR
ncbi:MAG: hypothetical protein ACNA7W_09205 [Pseudomonadales bacterium]